MKTHLILLLFACTLFSCNSPKEGVLLTVTNTSDFVREKEIIEVSLDSIGLRSSADDLIVIDGKMDKQIPYQITAGDKDDSGKLIFLVDLKVGETNSYIIKKGVPEIFTPLVYGRLVPERKDDFAWENNRTAFRVYGPALEATGEISNGMDFWAKRTDSLIIDKWYANDLAGNFSYHKDHGEGLDFYKVGRTLGLGMTSPYVDDSLILGNNFLDYKILDNGPLRITFQLTYKNYNAAGIPIDEIRTISLDAFNYLNKVQFRFSTTSDISEIKLATGIVMQNLSDTVFTDAGNGVMAYQLPTDAENGTIYTGVINNKGFSEILIKENHLLGINSYDIGTDYTYYSGGGWSKSGFNDFNEWVSFLNKQRMIIAEPLKIEIMKD